jgi:2-polyprenyl-3-methyl-5-hydroxy-6-metoxy-1,4-benzoquinol methylase
MTDDVGYSSNAEFWVKIMRERLDRYRTELTDLAVLSVLGDLEGKNVLDAGCGEGYLSRIMADRGATVSAIDLNHDLVAAARELETAEPNGITYEVGSITEPLPFETDSFDACVFNHVLNDIPNIGDAFKQVRDVLRPDGQIVALVLHPCFYWARSGLDEANPEWVHRYHQLRPRLQGFNVAGIESPSKVQAWYRPLEAYITALTDNGYVLTDLTEPHPSPELLSEKWWAETWKRPIFLLLAAAPSRGVTVPGST